jgi:hypothetical protein
MARVKGTKVAKCSVCGRQVVGFPGESKACRHCQTVNVIPSLPAQSAPVSEPSIPEVQSECECTAECNDCLGCQFEEGGNSA